MLKRMHTALIKKYDLTERNPVQTEHDCDSPNISSFSEFQKASMSCIAGYIVKTVDNSVVNVVVPLALQIIYQPVCS